MALVKLNNRGVRSATTFGSISALGSITFIKKLTASSSATLSFVDGSSSVVLDNTYKEYLFTFKDIHPATNDTIFTFQTDTGTNTSYNQTMTTTFFQTRHTEDDTTQSGAVTYSTNRDQGQATGFQKLNYDTGNGNDESVSGILRLFDPSNTTFVKHFISRASNYGQSDESADCFVAGYVNTTTALTSVQFKFASGNMDTGTIKMYGVV